MYILLVLFLWSNTRDHGVVTNSKASHRDHRALTGCCPFWFKHCCISTKQSFPSKGSLQWALDETLEWPLLEKVKLCSMMRRKASCGGWVSKITGRSSCSSPWPPLTLKLESLKLGVTKTQCWPVRHKWELLVWLPKICLLLKEQILWEYYSLLSWTLIFTSCQD